MKKAIKVLIILLVISFIPLAVQAQPGSQPHPDPYSGDLSNYEGKWIIDGKTEQDTNWTLEISGDKYHLHNEYHDYKGDILFTPGNEKLDTPDTLWLDFDPDVQIEVVLINQAGGLIDISGQGLYFVKPGNRIEFDEVEEWENYSKEDMVGDWVLDSLWAIIVQLDFYLELTNEDIMQGSITGDDRLILSFDNGILYEVSEKLEIRVPITRYRYRGRYIYFENPNPIEPVAYKFLAHIVPNSSDLGDAGQLIISPSPIPDMDDGLELIMFLTFSRITSVDQTEGSE